MMKTATDILSDAEKAGIRNMDRMLPSQPVMRKLFKQDADDAFYAALEAVLLTVLPHTSVASRWDLELKPGVSYASLGSDICTLNFYQLLIRLGGLRKVLELGTYIGVSTLYLAEAVGERGQVTTVERGQEFYDIACRNFRRNHLDARIRPLIGGALEVLQAEAATGASYDFILIDAGKEEYALMLTPALACLKPGGLIIVDDVFMNGDSLNQAPHTDKGQGVRDMLAEIAALPESYHRFILPIGNGTLLIRSPA